MQEKLAGQFVTLIPLTESHREILRPLVEDANIWAYMPSISTGKYFNDWFDKALSAQTSGSQMPFVVLRNHDQIIVGSTRFYNIDYDNKRLHIGYTWYVQEARGSQINPEAKWLLLKLAFESLDVNRVEFNADARNLRSCAAIEKLGAIKEGVLRKHMLVHNDYVRDTVVFSIIKDQWLAVQENLQVRLKSGGKG